MEMDISGEDNTREKKDWLMKNEGKSHKITNTKGELEKAQ